MVATTTLLIFSLAFKGVRMAPTVTPNTLVKGSDWLLGNASFETAALTPVVSNLARNYLPS